jgi:hypothetical protein
VDATVKILSLLEGTKFSANSDISVLAIATDLVYTQNKDLWKKNTSDRALLLDLLAGKLALSLSVYNSRQDLKNIVLFIQGLTMLAVSLVNGLGRSPISATRNGEEIHLRVNSKAQTIRLIPGKFDAETGKLLKEFKLNFFGSATDETFSRNDCAVIKEAFKETLTRLKNEKKFIEKVAKDPTIIFGKGVNEQTFASSLFLLLSALPGDSLNFLLMNIGSYLPLELDEVNEDLFKVNVRNYLSSSTNDMHELFKKIRLLLKLYFGRQRQIVAIIVKEKTQELFAQLINNTTVKKEVQRHLTETANNQFAVRITILDGLSKLL